MVSLYAVLMILLAFFLDFTLVMKLGILTSLAGTLIILPAAGICWLKGYSPAKFLFFGWLAFALGVVLMSFRSLGIVPDTFITMYGSQIGLSAKVIFLFISLANQVKVLNLEKNWLREGLSEKQQEAHAAQSALLFAQIRPHFLFNTLNTISYMVYVDPEKASELIEELSVYLRATFEFKEVPKLTTLEDELELVKAYVNIEKTRFFSHQLEVEFDIEVSEHTYIPTFSIQPLVENAINHGLRDEKQKGGKVIVSCKNTENGILVSVEDNGRGIPEEKLATILEKPAEEQEKSGIGLWNINSRLKNLYDTELKIKSRLNSGTKVEFEIPK